MLAGFGYALALFVRGLAALLVDLAREPGRRAALGPAKDETKPAHLLAFGVDLEAIARDAEAARFDPARPETLPGALSVAPGVGR